MMMMNKVKMYLLKHHFPLLKLKGKTKEKTYNLKKVHREKNLVKHLQPLKIRKVMTPIARKKKKVTKLTQPKSIVPTTRESIRDTIRKYQEVENPKQNRSRLDSK